MPPEQPSHAMTTPSDNLPHDFGDPRGEYEALTSSAGLVDLSSRTQIELVGPDRQTFLHNLCTNEIRRLQPGAGCEAFLCNAQGHVLALVYVFAGADSLVIDTVPGQEEKLLAQLDRYLIREKVELRGRSAQWGELLLAGPGAEEILRRFVTQLPEQLFQHTAATIAGAEVWLRRVDITRPHGYLIAAERSAIEGVTKALVAAGATLCGASALETARIEAGTPYFGCDVTDANLPQEIARDARAISFVKGCYIGQETVARLDSLGHVNRTLVGVKFAQTDVPSASTELTDETGKVVGQVTSATFSSRVDAPLALAFVRRGHNTPGTKLNSARASAEVVALPLER